MPDATPDVAPDAVPRATAPDDAPSADAVGPVGGEDAARERMALKEWAVLCDALERGDVVAMVRKGGIREQRAGFAVKHGRFLLYPTYFHEKAAELAPRFRERLPESAARRPAEGIVRVALVADVAGVWAVDDLERLRAVEPEQGLTWGAIESRFHYKNRPGVQVVAVRVRRLPAPVELPESRRYQGCVSWVALDEALDVRGAEPVVDDAVFGARLAALRSALGDPAPR